MVYVLDTDHISVGQQATGPRYERLIARMDARPREDFYATIVSFDEQVAGWNKYLNLAKTPEQVVRAYKQFEQVIGDFSVMQVLPFDLSAAMVFEQLRREKVRVPTLDLRIASIVLACNMVLLTSNLRHFRKVPGLKVEDWTAA